ncbi:ribbon-helix-helix protein, CopG family [Pseudomonas savastanoi]
MRGNREMFSVGFEPDLLAEFDAARNKLGLSRPALIKIAVRRLLDAGV